MSTRVVDIEKPYEWGTAIEVTQDKVINLRLRSENNLIIYDEWDNEIYVDLQLPSDIEPADAIPVWINTGRVLAADWWDYTGTIVVFKTTSWDNIKLLYADNGRVFIDNWTGTFKEIYLKWDVDALISGLRGYIDDELAKKQDKLTAWANITIQEDPQTHELVISSTGWGWASYTAWTGIDIDASDVISVDTSVVATQSDLADKQDVLTAWDNIIIEEVSLFDTQWPAPDGFHVPLGTEWQWLKTIMNWLSLTTWDSWRINLHMPFAGYRLYSTADLNIQGSSGFYWSSSPYGSIYPDRALFLSLDSSNVFADAGTRRANGYPVRCFKNSYVAPDASWILLQWGLWWAWLFWNQPEWLISITDWTTWYTIQDKNLWATTVYNDWDTLTQANMGNMYQWWNNYGFISTWSVSKTSSTQVNASAYWPTNPYSSDTFITWNRDWSSVQNDNLWGWVSQWQISGTVISVDSSTVALKSDLSSYIKTWNNAVSSASSGVELRHTTDSSNYEYVKVTPNRISASVCVNWASTQYSYYLTWTSNNRIARISDINSAVSVVSWDSNTYSIVVSNSAPASWTPNTTLTFVV